MTPQPGRHHTGIPQQAVPLQCCQEASRPIGLHYTRGDALADCRYCLPDVRGQPGSYRHLWHPQGVPACHSECGALRWLHTHTQTRTHTHSQTRTHTLSLSQTRTHTLSFKPAHTHTLSQLAAHTSHY